MKKWLFHRKEIDNFKKVSYSQCGEDLIVRYIFDLLCIKKPSFLDIGAHHAYYLSNTALFYENGSTGINVEPDPHLFSGLQKHRKRDKNLNIGITEKDGESDFYIMSSPTMNTFCQEKALELEQEYNFKILRKIKIKTLSIDSLIQQYCNNKVPEFLNIDAEGIDGEIVNSLGQSENRPVVICVETLSYSETGKGVKNNGIIDKIKNLDYTLLSDTYINSIFVHREPWENQ